MSLTSTTMMRWPNAAMLFASCSLMLQQQQQEEKQEEQCMVCVRVCACARTCVRGGERVQGARVNKAMLLQATKPQHPCSLSSPLAAGAHPAQPLACLHPGRLHLHPEYAGRVDPGDGPARWEGSSHTRPLTQSPTHSRIHPPTHPPLGDALLLSEDVVQVEVGHGRTHLVKHVCAAGRRRRRACVRKGVCVRALGSVCVCECVC